MNQKKMMTCAAGVIWNDRGQVLLAQRPAHKPMPLLWEFPGGKIEEGETPEQALCRELEEELGAKVDESALTPFTFISHAYPQVHVLIVFYHVTQWSGVLEAKEGQGGLEWVYPHLLKDFPMPELDEPLIEMLIHRQPELHAIPKGSDSHFVS